MMLYAIGLLGAAGGRGHAIEYAGPAVRALELDARLTLCNLSIEMGAKIGMIAPDDTVFDYLAGRPGSPQGRLFERAMAFWRSLPTDDGAHFDREVEIEASAIA